MTQNASEICHCLLLATLLFQKGIEYRHSLQSVLPTHNPISLWPKRDQSLVSLKIVIATYVIQNVEWMNPKFWKYLAMIKDGNTDLQHNIFAATFILNISCIIH